MTSADATAELEVGLSPQARRRRLIFRRFIRRPLAVTGLTVALLFVIVAIFAPQLSPYDPDALDIDSILSPPSREWNSPPGIVPHQSSPSRCDDSSDHTFITFQGIGVLRIGSRSTTSSGLGG